MENEKEKSLEDKIQESFMINSALAFMPSLPEMYPKIVSGIDMLDGGIDSFLGDNEKMVVVTRRNGVTRAIILNTQMNFTLTNSMKLDAPNGNPVINNYEKNEWKKKLLDSMPMQTLKERHERLSAQEGISEKPVKYIGDSSSENIGDIMGQVSDMIQE